MDRVTNHLNCHNSFQYLTRTAFLSFRLSERNLEGNVMFLEKMSWKHIIKAMAIVARRKKEMIAEANSIRVSFLMLRILIMQGRIIGTNWEFKNIRPKFQIKCLFKNSESLLKTEKCFFSIFIIESDKYAKTSSIKKTKVDPKFPRRYST